MSVPSQEAVNTYLDALRDSGKTNMYAATPFLRSRFHMSRDRAIEMLAEWMRTFSERHAAPESKGGK